jgi:DNA-binding GntR family transcriptional regulator
MAASSSARKDTAAEPVKGSRHRDAVSVLREKIQSGAFAVGERLREVALSESLGMSRTPVREALRTLAAEGLVTLLPNRSVVVAALDTEESTDVFFVLGALESLAGRLACERITDDEIEVLKDLQAELERRFEAVDRLRYTEINRAIHSLIVHAARNQSLLAAWQLIVPRAERPRALNNIDPNRWASSIDSHRKIFAALLARDAHLLSSLLHAHFAHSIIERMAVTSARAAPGRSAGRAAGAEA